MEGFDRMVREESENMTIEDVVDKVLEEMPEDFQIKPFLMENKGEVKKSILTEYNEEKHLRLTRIQAREEGIKEGQDILIEVIGRLRGGETTESILSSGVDQSTIDKALSVL